MGSAKALLPFGDVPLLLRMIRIVRPKVDTLVVVAAAETELPALPDDVSLVRDDRPFLGPLNGLAAGLTTLRETHRAAFVCSCDLPFLRPEVVGLLADSLDDFEAVVPHVAGYPQPLCAVYRTSLGPRAKALVDSGERRMVALIDAVRTRVIHEPELWPVDLELESFWNINTPEDYREAMAKWSAKNGA
jgi:molybdenum cofactor guanylyltransferase